MAFADGSTVNDAEKARAEYETTLAERDARIEELEGEIAEAQRRRRPRTSCAPK